MLLSNKKTGKQAEIDIRPFKSGDEAQFEQCINDFYRDGYPYKEYFENGFLDNLCRSGKMHLLCAFTDSGEMVGTVGARLSDEFPGSALMCLRVVKRAYQGLGIASMQRTALLEYLNGRDDIKSIYVDALAHDKFSQQDLLQFGFITCGLRLQLYKADVMIPGGGYSENDRISQTIMCKSQGQQNVGVVFCPKEHEGFVAKCYDKLGVRYKFGNVRAASGETDIDEHYDTNHKSAILILRNAGRDFDNVLTRCIDKGNSFGLKSLVCYVNLSHPGAGDVYGFLKSRGFFFSGIKPLNEDGEYMLMTLISDGYINRGLINACDDGDELIEYIFK